MHDQLYAVAPDTEFAVRVAVFPTHPAAGAAVICVALVGPAEVRMTGLPLTFPV